jgi:MFS family permease
LPLSGRKLLALLVVLGMANHSVLTGTRVIIALDALSFGSSPLTVGTLMALFALMPMVSAIAVGRLSDRIGTRVPSIVGTIGVLIGAGVPVFWRGLPGLVVSATLLGLSFMAFQLATQRAVGEIGGSAERARNFSWLALGYSGSGFIGPLIAGYSIDHLGYTLAFAVLAALPLFPLAVLSSRRIPLPGPQPPSGTGQHGGIRALLRHRTLRNVMVVNVLLSAAWDLHTVFVPIYGERLGLSASEIGIVLALFAIATFVIRLLTPMLVRGRGERDLLMTSLYIAGLIYLLFPFAQSFVLLGVASFVLGLALGSGQPIVLSLLHAHAPSGRVGETVGVRMSLINTSAVAIPLLFGAVGTTLGLTPVFWSMGVFLTSGGWFARRHPHSR